MGGGVDDQALASHMGGGQAGLSLPRLREAARRAIIQAFGPRWRIHDS